MESKEYELKAKLIQKIMAVAKKVGKVNKDGHNKHQNYDFTSHTAASTAVRAACQDVGIWVMPEVVSHSDQTWEAKDKYGKLKHYHRVTINYEIEIIDSETGYSITKKWSGSEQDTGGKAFQQAVTTALKYFDFKNFRITDQEAAKDPDSKTTEGAPPKKLPALDVNHKQWSPSIKWLSTGGTIGELKKHYTISESHEKVLLESAKNLKNDAA